MNETAERLELLIGELSGQLAAQPGPTRTDIDLSGVTEIDASGCQLLSVFLGNLKGRGITPKPCNIPPQLGDAIRLLGFAEAFSCGAAEVKSA